MDRPTVGPLTKNPFTPLDFHIVHWDGPPISQFYHPLNLLQDNISMLYATEKNKNLNLVFKHAKPTTFNLRKIFIRNPGKGFSSPLRDALVFVSLSPINLDEVKKFDDFTKERISELENCSQSFEAFFIEMDPRHLHMEKVLFPPKQGNYILIKFLNTFGGDVFTLEYVSFSGSIIECPICYMNLDGLAPADVQGHVETCLSRGPAPPVEAPPPVEVPLDPYEDVFINTLHEKLSTIPISVLRLVLDQKAVPHSACFDKDHMVGLVIQANLRERYPDKYKDVPFQPVLPPHVKKQAPPQFIPVPSNSNGSQLSTTLNAPPPTFIPQPKPPTTTNTKTVSKLLQNVPITCSNCKRKLTYDAANSPVAVKCPICKGSTKVPSRAITLTPTTPVTPVTPPVAGNQTIACRGCSQTLNYSTKGNPQRVRCPSCTTTTPIPNTPTPLVVKTTGPSFCTVQLKVRCSGWCKQQLTYNGVPKQATQVRCPTCGAVTTSNG